MAIEYLYWAIVSQMGILDDPGTCAGIANEWEPCSPALFQSTDVAMFDLITDPQFKLPLSAPDGNYCPALSIEEETMTEFVIFPNPASDFVKCTSNITALLQLTDTSGKVVLEYELEIGENTIELSSLTGGIYIVTIENEQFKLTIEN